DYPALQDELAQQVQGHRNLIGLVIDCLLGQCQAYPVRQRREEMGARGALLLAAAQGLAIDSDSVLDLLDVRRLTQVRRPPGPEPGFYGVAVYTAAGEREG